MESAEAAVLDANDRYENTQEELATVTAREAMRVEELNRKVQAAEKVAQEVNVDKSPNMRSLQARNTSGWQAFDIDDPIEEASTSQQAEEREPTPDTEVTF